MFVSTPKAAEMLGVHAQTLRNWDRAGVLVPVRLPSGHRRYLVSDLEALLGVGGSGAGPRRCAVSARVSTRKQQDMGNLDRQVERLLATAASDGYVVVSTHTEVASGPNTKRRGLARVIRAAKSNAVDVVLVEHKDRWARFGFEYLQQLFSVYGADVVVAEAPGGADGDGGDAHAEVGADMIAIVASFAASLYGSRGGRRVRDRTKLAVRYEEQASEAA